MGTAVGGRSGSSVTHSSPPPTPTRPPGRQATPAPYRTGGKGRALENPWEGGQASGTWDTRWGRVGGLVEGRGQIWGLGGGVGCLGG